MTMMPVLISFVIPCYRSENTIETVITQAISVVAERIGYEYEIVAVNDCSPDNVMTILRRLARDNVKIKVISFSKNMGKHAAVLAGYAVAEGDYVIDIDDDCQCPLNELWRLLDPVIRGECDYATAKYKHKRESLIKRCGSDLNLVMSSILLDKPWGLRFENFNAMKRFVAREMIRYRHPYPYLEGLVLRATRSVSTVEMEQHKRGDDLATGFTMFKSVSLLLNGLTAFSVIPLRLASLLGVLVATSGFGYALIIIVRRLFNPAIAAGFSSLMAVVLITAGTIMCLLGVIGEYLGRIYICLNSSPQYVIKESYNIRIEDATVADT